MPLQHRTGLGIALAMFGGLMISIDIPIIRLAQTDVWLMMFCRGIGLALVLGFILLLGRNLTETPKNPFGDREWVELGILYGVSSILFTTSVFNTSTANLVFILAFNPMLAALFAWLLIGERPGKITWIAIILTFTGVAVIVSDGLEGGTITGDLTSLAAATVLAFSLVRTRQSGKDMSLTPAFGGMVAASFALPLALVNSGVPGVPGWILFNVLIIGPCAGFTLALAPRFIPAAQVAMFFLLETILAPIWVWLIFADVPTNQTLIGGAIVLTAIAGHSFWQLKAHNAISD